MRSSAGSNATDSASMNTSLRFVSRAALFLTPQLSYFVAFKSSQVLNAAMYQS
jgi:hypothetical protein